MNAYTGSYSTGGVYYVPCPKSNLETLANKGMHCPFYRVSKSCNHTIAQNVWLKNAKLENWHEHYVFHNLTMFFKFERFLWHF